MEENIGGELLMSVISMKQLLEAGVLWTPDKKMESEDGGIYLYGKERHIHYRSSENSQEG